MCAETDLAERLRQARLLGSFIAYYHAGREWYADWFNGLPRGDQAIIFDIMLDQRRKDISERRERFEKGSGVTA